MSLTTHPPSGRAPFLAGRRSFLVAAVCLCAHAAGAQPAGTAERRLIDRWVAMWNSYDLREVDSLFVSDSTASYFSSEYRGAIRGLGELRKHHERFGFVVGGKQQANRLWLEDVVMTPTGGGGSLVTAQWRFQRPGGAPPQTGPVTFVLTRVGGPLRLLHAHFANDPPK